MILSLNLLLQMACQTNPYPAYWEKNDLAPSIENASPDTVEGRIGGQTLTISGSNLLGTRTVVIGSRNAEISAVTETEITVVLPENIGSKTLDIAIVTDHGIARKNNALTVESLGVDWWTEEVSSVALVRMECPVEAYAVFEEDYYPIFWCGLEMGNSSAEAVLAKYKQPGFSGQLSFVGGVSDIPLNGEAIFKGAEDSRALKLPNRYGDYRVGDRLSITTARDFQRDIDFITERTDLFRANYYWAEDIIETATTIAVYDEKQCWLYDASAAEINGDRIQLDGIDEQSANILMGFSAQEDYEGEIYVYEGYTSSARVSPVGESLQGAATGIQFEFDDYSGQFIAANIAGQIGLQDLPNDESYVVELTQKGDTQVLGEIQSPSAFQITYPDLLAGQEQLSKSADYEVEWDTNAVVEDPSVVVLEYRVYDFDVESEAGWHEVASLVKGAAFSDGYLAFTTDELALLPNVPNAMDEAFNMIGLWGELTLVRHAFQKVPHGDGEMVVDFVDGTQSMADLID